MSGAALGAVATAPHLRDASSVAGLMRHVVAALLPCVVVGAWNTGRQACAALPLLEPGAEAGLRVDLLRRFGLELQPDRAVACLLLGLLYLLPLLMIATAATLAWKWGFARARSRPGAGPWERAPS